MPTQFFFHPKCVHISGYRQRGYSNNLDCRWYIEVNDTEAILEIKVEIMRIEKCEFDRLDIYRGESNAQTCFFTALHSHNAKKLLDCPRVPWWSGDRLLMPRRSPFAPSGRDRSPNPSFPCTPLSVSLDVVLSGDDVSDAGLVESLCGTKENVAVRVQDSRAVLRLLTDEQYTDEGFKLNIKPCMIALPHSA